MKPNRLFGLAAAAIFPLLASGAASKPEPLSPTALVASPKGDVLYVACATAGKIIAFDPAAGQVLRQFAVPESPLGLAISPDGKTLYVTCAAPESVVCALNTASGSITSKLPTGHTAMAPILSPDGSTIYICNRFNNEVAAMSLASKKVLRRTAVPREPVAAALTHDGKYLLVANHLHAGRSDVNYVASSVSVIDPAKGTVLKELALPSGSGLLRDVQISPDGKYAAVSHLLSRFHLPTTQLERGWVNTSAVTIIRMDEIAVVNTVLLDNIDSGAANPWAIAWTADNKQLLVTHAGTHEVSVIDFPALLQKLARFKEGAPPIEDTLAASRKASDVPNDLSFLVGVRKRIKLSETDRGPRSIAVIGSKAYVAGYFTDSIAEIDLNNLECHPSSKALQPPVAVTVVRRGELLFNDATICFQGWQSCSSCHSSDARVDGLNWDNLNDGIGNPKNAKSLLLAHRTPPSMWLGVRSNAYVAVRMGIRNSLFTVRPEEDAVALDEYLKSLQPIPSPHLVRGKLSASAERGKKLFTSEKLACTECHKGALFTDQKFHDVGTAGKFDQPADRFDTPTLIELWRSGPYLHDGRAATVQEVIAPCDRNDKHGTTSHLNQKEIDDLAEYLLSL